MYVARKASFVFTHMANLQPFLLYFIDWHIFLPKKYKIEWGLYIQQMRRACPSHLIIVFLKVDYFLTNVALSTRKEAPLPVLLFITTSEIVVSSANVISSDFSVHSLVTADAAASS